MVTQDRLKNRIRELRERSNLTQKELAKLLDLSAGAVTRHELGERALSASQVEAYARVFKVSTYELFLDPLTNPEIVGD